MKQNDMMDRIGIIHYAVCKNNEIINAELFYWWERNLINNKLLNDLKDNRKKWFSS